MFRSAGFARSEFQCSDATSGCQSFASATKGLLVWLACLSIGLCPRPRKQETCPTTSMNYTIMSRTPKRERERPIPEHLTVLNHPGKNKTKVESRCSHLPRALNSI